MKVEVAVQTHYFQKRLCWLLSSMCQQEHTQLELGISVAYVKGNGEPSTEEVLETFQGKLPIRRLPYPDTSDFQYRGLVRNRQLDETDADWIIFADSDMVYPPSFFPSLERLLQTPAYQNNPHCLYSRRFSTLLKETEALIDQEEYPAEIKNAWDKAHKLPGARRRNVGAGYFQLANVPLLKANYGYYQKPGKKLDWSWEKRHQKAKSDVHFRKMLGREPINLPVQIHLQHVRDSDYGTHIEVQR